MIKAYVAREKMLNAINEVISALDDDYRNSKTFGGRCEALIFKEAAHLVYTYLLKVDFEFFNTEERIDKNER